MNWKEWTALLYPPECPVCQKLLSDTEDRRRHIHGDCYRKLRRIVEPMCKRCGKPLLSAQQEYCYDCQRRPSACEAGHSLWMYDAYRDWIESLHVQQLIPVPLSRRKQRQRGFNQAALLAEKIAEGLSLPVNTRGLRRIHSTAPQKKLGKYERGENLKHAFVADALYLQGVRRVLLIDDIYTTGSTVNYCAGALKQAGIEKVWFLTLCTGGVF